MKTNGIEQLKKIEENYNKNKNLKEMEDAMEKLPIEIINYYGEDDTYFDEDRIDELIKIHNDN